MFLILILLFSGGALCDNILPIHFDLTITPNLDDLSFTASSEITVNVEAAQKTIERNWKDVTINSVQMFDSSGAEVQTVGFTQVDGIFKLEFVEDLQPNLYKILIAFSGKLNEEHVGVYVAKYKDVNVEKKLLLANFHDTSAQIFPFFESVQVATYKLTTIAPSGYQAVSNSPKTSHEASETQVTDVFATTDPFPYQWFSFALLPDFIEKEGPSSIMYLPSNDVETEFVENVTAAFAKSFQETHGFKFEKMFQVVVPDETINQDSISNIGIVYYRNSLVDYNEARDTVEDLQTVVTVVTHSVALQSYREADWSNWATNWFVMEGSTVLLQLEILEKLWPNYRIGEQYSTNQVSQALQNDETSSQARDYSLVRMFTHLPRPGNILQDPTNIIRTSWTKDNNFPVLKVVNNNNLLVFTQAAEIERTIPINVIFEDQDLHENYDVIMEVRSLATTFNEYNTSSWYFVNNKRLGFFRTEYDVENWRSLSNFLINSTNRNKIPALNRAILLDDFFYSANEGTLNFTEYLEFVKVVEKEDDFLPLDTFIKSVDHIATLLGSGEAQNLFKAFSRSLIDNLYKTGTWPTHSDKLKGIKIFTWLCKNGNEKCLNDTLSGVLNDNFGSDPNVQDLYFCGAMRSNAIEVFKILINQYTLIGKTRILKSLACTSSLELLERYYLPALLDNSDLLNIKQTHKVDAYLAILNEGSSGLEATLRFTKQHLEHFLQQFTTGEITEMFEALSKKIVTTEQKKIVDDMFECLTNDQKITFRDLFDVMASNFKKNQNWSEKHTEAITKWVEAWHNDNKGNNGSSSVQASVFSYFITAILFLIVIKK